jgi:hypothetical protein
MTSVGSFAVALARLGDPRIMARMPPTKLWSSADLDAVIERVAPDVPNLLALLLRRSSRQAGSPSGGGGVAFRNAARDGGKAACLQAASVRSGKRLAVAARSGSRQGPTPCRRLDPRHV